MARAMKDSGIAWIGEIAEGFEVIKLKYLSDILDQYRSPITADKRNQDADMLYDYYGASGAIDKIDGYTIDDHVMLIGEDGANLKMRNLPLMYEVNGKAWINNHAHILKPKSEVDFYYLFYALEALDLNTYITGSAQPKLSQENLKNIWIPISQHDVQIKISMAIREKCQDIDALIEQTRASIEEYKKLKQAVITQAVTKGIRPNRPMKDSGINSYGIIPETWDCCKLKYLISSLNSGVSVIATDLVEEGYPVYGGGQQIGFLSRYNMENTLVVGRVGAKCGCVTKIEGKAWATDNALIVSSDFSIDYLYYILVAAELNKLNTSNAQPLITSGKILNFKVPICWDIVEQKEIIAYLDSKTKELDLLMQKKGQLISDLQAYKKSMIFEYITGKKEVQ